jgi:hypothetical protein
VLSQYVNGYRELGRSKPCISCFLGVILYLRCRGRGVFYLTSVLADASMHPGPRNGDGISVCYLVVLGLARSF